MLRTLAVLLALSLVSPVFAATRVGSASKCQTEEGSQFELPANVLIVTEAEWEDVDLHMRELQDDVTKLAAENNSLKLSLQDAGEHWYWWAASGLLLGAALAYSERALAK